MPCDTAQLLEDAKCIQTCIPAGMQQAAAVSLLCQLAGGVATGPYVLKSGDTMTGALLFTNLASNFIQVPFVWARLGDANSNTQPVTAELYHETSGGAGGGAVNGGVSLDFRADSATVDRQQAVRISSLWSDATQATLTSQLRIIPTLNAVATEALRISNAFVDARNGTFFAVGGTQVVSARSNGWATFGAGVANKNAAALDTATVTTAQLAQIVKALMDALIAHGLIGA